MQSFKSYIREDDHGFTSDKDHNIKKAMDHIKKLGLTPKKASRKGFHGVAWYKEKTNTIHVNTEHSFWENPVENQRKHHQEGLLSSDHPFHIIHHEQAHHIYKPVKNYFPNGNGPGAQPEISKEVSRYAATNPNEFVAEVHAGIKSGKTYSKNIMDKFHQHAIPR